MLSLAVSAFVAVMLSNEIGGVRHFLLHDDPFISMRYARNLAAGDGLVWNPGGAPVEGYSNLLWVLAMAAVHSMPVAAAKTSLVVQATGALLLVANVLLGGRLALRLSPGDGRFASFGMIALALYYPFAFWTIGGFETGLVTFLILAGCLGIEELAGGKPLRARGVLACALALLVLTRPDGVVPAAALLAYAVVRERRPRRIATALLLAAAIAVPYGAQAAFRIAYYGDPMPNTYYLKLAGIPLGRRLFMGLGYGFQLLVDHLWLIALPACMGAGTLLRARNPLAAFFVALFLLCSAYSVYVGADAWEEEALPNRYLIVAMPGVLLLFVRGALDVWESRDTRPVAALAGLLTAAVLFRTLWKAILPDFYPALAGNPLPVVARAAIMSALFGALAIAAGLGARRVVLGAMSIRTARPRVAGRFLAAIAIVAMNANALEWAANLGTWSHIMSDAVRYARQLRAGTAGDATIAVTSAGAIPYFMERNAVDLLGKCDPVVARLPPHRLDYLRPGHAKWDFAHSVGVLRPDVVAQLHHDPRDEVRYMTEIGYVPLPGAMFVDSRSDRVHTGILSLDRYDPVQFAAILGASRD